MKSVCRFKFKERQEDQKQTKKKGTCELSSKMRVPAKLFGFVVWLLSLDCGQCQGPCHRDSITYQYVEPLPEASYESGKTVKVTCQTGFTGMYKLNCENGEWKENIARPCQKKKCSHPGDAANGDFQLVDETEFVFGARVVYSCKKGFEMTSRINQRTCRSQGWDNAVPVCEAVKCPAIHADEDVTATGNVEEGNYGDVIRFECVSPEKKIDGSRDIYCTEKGEWSAPVPKCIVITCKSPNIQNGEVVDDPESIYPNNAQLKYRCFKGFKAREGVPKCASHGWTLNPECDAITCELKSTFKVKSVNPEGKTIFRVGEMVGITCTEEGWFSTKEVSKTFTCKDNGEWDSIPVCHEITCERPRDQHVSTYFWGTMKLGERKSYSCDKGYYKMETEATCTRDGLTPKPLCAEIVCPTPDIPNAEIVSGRKQKYKLDSAIQYRCQTGFEPQGLVQITCKSPDQWMGIQQCTGLCAAPNIKNGQIEDVRQSYSTGLTIRYYCNMGFEPEGPVQITCEDRQWTGLRQCTAKSKKCQALSVKNGFTDGQTPDRQEIFYSCDTGYKPFTGKWWSSVMCNKGSWPEDPLCILEEECGALPSVQNGKLNLKDRETAEVVCDQGFNTNQSSVKCINGIWEEPSCKVGKKCDIPPKVENALITSKPKVFYLEGYNVTYKCRSKFSLTGESTVFCRNGQWEETPTCVASKECDSPPELENADIIPKPGKNHEDGSSVTYECRSPFTMKGKNIVFCRNGKWEETPTCEVHCPRPHENSMELKSNKDMFDNKEIVKYKCLEPYTEIPGGEWTCENGKWTGNFVCTSKICPPPPYVENGDHVISNTVNKVTTEVYYQCQANYVLSERPTYYECKNGKWETPPSCLKPCTITPSLLEKHNMETIQQTIYIQHSENRISYCKPGLIINRTRLRYMYMRCTDGKLDIELCQ